MHYNIQQTKEFETWLTSLKDERAQARIAQRLVRLQAGLFGDVKRLGPVSELRIDYGPGYRLYFCLRGRTLVLLLCGGTKKTQAQDIDRAKSLALRLDGERDGT